MRIINQWKGSEKVFLILIVYLLFSLFLPTGFTSVGVILLFLFCLLNLDFSIDKIKERKLLLIPIFLYLLYVVWAMAFDQLKNSYPIIERKIPLLALPLGFMFVNIKLSRESVYLILRWFLYCCVICSIICYAWAVWNIIENKGFFIDTPDRRYYYFSYNLLAEPIGITPIYLSIYYNFALIIALNCLKKQIERIILVVYISIFIILLASKIGLICFAFICVLHFLFAKRGIVQKSFLILALLLLVGLSIYKFPFLRERFITSLEFNYNESYGGRWNSVTAHLAQWSCSLEAIKRSPIIGYGPYGGQAALENVYREREYLMGLQEHFNSHNEFFTTTLDLGIIGLVTLLLLIGLPLIAAYKGKNIISISFLMILLFFCLAESIFLRQKGIVFLSILYPLLFGQLLKTSS